jgi:RNA recognition motif-containing protein
MSKNPPIVPSFASLTTEVFAALSTKCPISNVAEQGGRPIENTGSSMAIQNAPLYQEPLHGCGKGPNLSLDPISIIRCNTNNKLYIGNITPAIKASDLMDIFSAFGTFKSPILYYEYYAFVEYIESEAAQRAIKAINGRHVVILEDESAHVAFQTCTDPKQTVIKLVVEAADPLKTPGPFRSRGHRSKFDGCYSCGKPGHMAFMCTNIIRKKRKPTSIHRIYSAYRYSGSRSSRASEVVPIFEDGNDFSVSRPLLRYDD